MSAGALLAIGGPEDRTRERSLLRTFVEAAGGRRSRLVVLAAPPEGPLAGGHYEILFEDLRAGRVEQLRIAAPGEPEGAALDVLERATGLFLTGSSLLRLAAALGGTPLGEAIRRRHSEGLVVAGLGAGASVLASRVMLETPRRPSVPAAGLGLVDGLFLDAALRPRDRFDRLLAGLDLLSPEGVDLALGLDPDTGALISGDGLMIVLGSGAVTVAQLPPRTASGGADAAAARAAAGGEVVGRGRLPPATLGLRLDVLSPGCRYDLGRRTALPPLGPAPGGGVAVV